MITMYSRHISKLLISLLLIAVLWTPNCWTKALFYATTINIVEKTDENIRIALMHTQNPYIGHAEAQVNIDGQWKCLDYKDGNIIVTDKKLKTKPYLYLTLKEALKTHLEMLRMQKLRKIFKKHKKIL